MINGGSSNANSDYHILRLLCFELLELQIIGLLNVVQKTTVSGRQGGNKVRTYCLFKANYHVEPYCQLFFSVQTQKCNVQILLRGSAFMTGNLKF